MVPRYSRPEMTAIWSGENRYRIWWQIEVFAAEAMGKIDMIPAQDAATIRSAYNHNALGQIDIDAIDKIGLLQGQKHNLDVTKLQACFKAQNEDGVRASMKEADGLGVNATPTFLINGKRYSGDMSVDIMSALIDSLL